MAASSCDKDLGKPAEEGEDVVEGREICEPPPKCCKQYVNPEDPAGPTIVEYGETQVDDAEQESDNNASQDTLQVSSETGSASQDEEPGDGHDGVTQHYAFVEDLAVFLHEPSGASLA